MRLNLFVLIAAISITFSSPILLAEGYQGQYANFGMKKDPKGKFKKGAKPAPKQALAKPAAKKAALPLAKKPVVVNKKGPAPRKPVAPVAKRGAVPKQPVRRPIVA